MKKVFKIARLELNIMFYSPIAWLLLIIFGVQAGLTFTDILYGQETNQQLERPLRVLSKVLFAGDKGLFKAVQDTLYLYIPLLTMGLLSRETSSGSIKLLFSSPVRISEIVLGKFLSVVIYAFLLMMVLFLYVIAADISIEALDFRFVLGGVLGLFLLACSYAAIGLFMSSLTSYQVVAAISTLAVLAGLNFVGEIGQQYDLVRNITYWMSIAGRTDNMVNGLITSRDLIYFALVISLFVCLTIMKLNSGRQTLSFMTKTFRFSALFGLVLLIGYVSSLPRFTGYFDTTRFKDRTITQQSQALLKQIKEPVSITSYVNVVHYTAPYGAPKNRISDVRQFETYQRFLPDLKMNYVMYYDTTMYYNDSTKTLLERAREASEGHGFPFKKLLTPEQIKNKIDLSPEENRFVRILKIGDKATPLRMFEDMIAYPREAEISAAIKRLLAGPAVAGFLTGKEERSIEKYGDKDYKAITRGLGTRGALINQGFDVKAIDYREIKDSLADLTVLVVSDPKTAYSAEEIAAMEAYISSGGNMLIAGEPGRQHLLNPLLESLGVSLKDGTLLEESENFEPDLIQASFTQKARETGYGFYDQAVVTMPGAAGIEVNSNHSFQVDTLLATNYKTTWNKLEDFDLKVEKVVFDSSVNSRISAPVAIALSRNIAGKTQKIMVLGDADFMSNAEVSRFTPNNVNSAFVIRMFKWFTDGEYPVDLKREEALDTKIAVTRKQINWQKGLFLGILPLSLILLASVILIRRKRN